MKMSELEAHAEFCIANKLPLSILVTESRLAFPKKIIHPFENIPAEMNFYRLAYNDDCKRNGIDGEEIIAVVDSQEQTLLTGEAQLFPYTSSILENHIRVEDRYVIDSREKEVVIEGRVEDVMQVLKYIKAGESND